MVLTLKADLHKINHTGQRVLSLLGMLLRTTLDMIDKLNVSVSFTGDELYETIKLYDILRDMDFELSETQVEVFEKLQDAEVNAGFF